MKQLRLIARDYFVESGFNVPTILSLLEGQVTKKTLYNWKNNVDAEDPNGTWDEQRRVKIQEYEDVEHDLMDLLKMSVREAKVDPSSKNYFAVAKMIGALKQYKSLNLEDDLPVEEIEDDLKKKDPKAFVEKLQKHLLG